MRWLAAGLVLAAAACATLPEADDAPRASDIRALRWLAPGADKVAALTARPVACGIVPEMPPSKNERLNYRDRYEIGRLAFESPALLGGAAGRMGLSCSSCHLNGRSNANFFLEGVSDTPGRADVSLSLFSKVRGDKTFNPSPIPDVAAKDGKQIKDRLSPAFRTKVHGLVVEEFDGAEPSPTVFEALISFMNAQDVTACADPSALAPVSATKDLADASLAFDEARNLHDMNELAGALLMARAARERLGGLHERFIAPDQAGLRNAVVSASRAIEAWMTYVQEHVGYCDLTCDPQGTAGNAMKQLDALRAPVEKNANASLYNPDVLRAALAREASDVR